MLESVVFIQTALGTHCFKGFVNLQYFKLVLAENFVGLIHTQKDYFSNFKILKEQNKSFFYAHYFNLWP